MLPQPNERRQPGISGVSRVYVLAGHNCTHEDWEHGAARQGCLVRGCKCRGWFVDMGLEAVEEGS